MEDYKLYHGDCLEVMRQFPDKSIDMILCDLPYGITACEWDTVIPLEPLWEQYKRVIKDNGAIVLTASQPFTSMLVMSNIKWFRYEWVWDKKAASGHLNAKQMPLKRHENILVFYKRPPVYNPQFTEGEPYDKGLTFSESENWGKQIAVNNKNESGRRYPTSLIVESNANRRNRLHPTQKPVALFEYLIKTYTNEGETVLDNAMGSGTTGVACLKTKRKFIGIELEEKYFKIAKERIEAQAQLERSRLF